MATLDTIQKVLNENLDIDFGEPEGIETIGQLVTYIEEL